MSIRSNRIVGHVLWTTRHGPTKQLIFLSWGYQPSQIFSGQCTVLCLYLPLTSLLLLLSFRPSSYPRPSPPLRSLVDFVTVFICTTDSDGANCYSCPFVWDWFFLVSHNVLSTAKEMESLGILTVVLYVQDTKNCFTCKRTPLPPLSPRSSGLLENPQSML